MAQERAHEGQDPGRKESAQQIRAANSDSFDVKISDLLRRAQKLPVMSASESSQLFRKLDKNNDLLLSRSELPDRMVILRAQFDRYDLDHDHRLSYSEFARYTDVTPSEVAD